MKSLKHIILLGFTSMLSSCGLVDLGMAYIGYSIIMIIALAISFFIFTIIYGITNKQGLSIFLTVMVAFILAAYIFKW